MNNITYKMTVTVNVEDNQIDLVQSMIVAAIQKYYY